MAFLLDDGEEAYIGGDLGAGFSQVNADLDQDIDAFYSEADRSR